MKNEADICSARAEGKGAPRAYHAGDWADSACGNQRLWKAAIQRFDVRGYDAWAAPDPLMGDSTPGYCGYVQFPRWFRGIEVDMNGPHGGVTYVKEDAFGLVVGFDTGHINSHMVPNRDLEWIREQCVLIVREAERRQGRLRLWRYKLAWLLPFGK